MIVVDASAIIEYLLKRGGASRVASRLFDREEAIVAPHLLDVEVAQIIRRYYLLGDVNAAEGQHATADLADFPMERFDHTPLLPRIWSLRQNMTAYDAAYIALAESLDATLITCDSKFARTPGHSAKIEVI